MGSLEGGALVLEPGMGLVPGAVVVTTVGAFLIAAPSGEGLTCTDDVDTESLAVAMGKAWLGKTTALFDGVVIVALTVAVIVLGLRVGVLTRFGGPGIDAVSPLFDLVVLLMVAAVVFVVVGGTTTLGGPGMAVCTAPGV